MKQDTKRTPARENDQHDEGHLVLYEDNHLLALFKPPGILVQGDRTGDRTLLDMARGYIAEKYNKPGRVYIGLVHRLDRPVAGVVIFARTSKASARLCAQIRERRIEKVYWAVLQGTPSPPAGDLAGHIIRHGRKSFISIKEREKAQEAILTYRTMESLAGFSLVEIILGTGRHHQIRVQMAAAGHPVLGDIKYGSSHPLPERAIALLAKRLVVEHPTRHKRIEIESPVPHNWPWPPGSHIRLQE
ncbi:MAG: RluA family pseudouridine synthase [bacterium]